MISSSLTCAEILAKVHTVSNGICWLCWIYTLFDGLTDNTRGYFTSCEQRVKCPRVLSVKLSNKRFIIPLHYFPVIFTIFIQ